jgi:hypothetical protein
MGGRRVPYYEAGAAFAPYGEGYFVGAVATQSLFVVPQISEGGPGGGDHGWGGFDGGGLGGGDAGGGGGE